jgi:hypothetical protein
MFMLFTISSFGQSEIKEPTTFSIQTDQDFLFRTPFSKNEDRNYTQGTSFVFSSPKLINTWIYFPLRKVRQLADSLNRGGLEDFSSSFALSGTAFTPRIIDSSTPIVGDRPFAFLLFVSTSTTFKFQKLRNDKAVDVYHSLTINYGVFGTDIGYKFQGWAHKHLVQGRPTDPKGWNTQISKGGAPAMLVEYNRFRELFPSGEFSLTKRKAFDIGWNAGGSIGYYDRLFTGLYARLGWLREKNLARWNGGFSAMNSGSFQVQGTGDVVGKVKKFFRLFEPFVYGRANGTLMLRNAMLVGQGFGNSVYTLKPGWATVPLFEYEWGVVVAVEWVNRNGKPKTGAVQYRAVHRSPEFDSGLFPTRWHYFGSLGLMIPL